MVLVHAAAPLGAAAPTTASPQEPDVPPLDRALQARVAALEKAVVAEDPATREAAATELLALLAELEPGAVVEPPVAAPSTRAWAYSQLARLAAERLEARIGRPSAARLYAGGQRALERSEVPRGLANYARDRAAWARQRELWAEAFDAVDTVLDGHRISPSARATLCYIAANCEQYAGSLARAERRLAQGQAALDELGADWAHRPDYEAMYLRLHVTIANGRGLPDEAAELLADALKRARSRGDTESIAELEIQRANLWLSAQRRALLEKQVSAALGRPELQAAEHASGRASLRLCLGTAYAGRARLDPDYVGRARTELQSVIDDSAATTFDVRRARLRLAAIELRGDAYSAAAELLRTVRADADPTTGRLPRHDETVCATLEVRLARRTATDTAARRTALTGAEVAVERLLGVLAAEPPRVGGLGYLHYAERRGLLSEYILLLIAVHGQATGAERALELLHRVQALGSRARRAGYVPVANAELRRLLLGPSEGLLIYLPAIEDGHVLAVDGSGTTQHRLPPVERMNAVRAKFHEAYDPRRPAQEWAAVARALRDYVLPEAVLEQVLGWDAVSIVGLDLLRPIPFERLPLDDGRILGDALTVAYLPSLPIGVQIAQRASPKPDSAAADLFLLAAPRYPPDTLPALEFNDGVRQRLSRGARRPLVYPGPAATAASLAAPQLAGARLLHILTHGQIDRSREIPVGLALAASEGRATALFTADVEALPAVPPVVILSACQAARGPGRLGEGGLEGLVGAFLERGASCVLVAFEDVEYAAVLDLVEVFQPLLLEQGFTPAAALREAQRVLAKRRPKTPAAAPLHAFGLGHRRLP